MVTKASWASPAEVKAQYGNASVVGNNRVVFNVAGNRYRLIVAFSYRVQVACVKFAGTHAAYDKVDAAAVDVTARSPRRRRLEIKPIHKETDDRAALREVSVLADLDPEVAQSVELRVPMARSGQRSIGALIAERQLKAAAAIPRDAVNLSIGRTASGRRPPACAHVER